MGPEQTRKYRSKRPDPAAHTDPRPPLLTERVRVAIESKVFLYLSDFAVLEGRQPLRRSQTLQGKARSVCKAAYLSKNQPDDSSEGMNIVSVDIDCTKSQSEIADLVFATMQSRPRRIPFSSSFAGVAVFGDQAAVKVVQLFR